ncbi:MAG: Uma2 family endonuclease [Planctomycetota bacterium]
MVTTTKFTRADYMALPEEYPAQLVEGELVRRPSLSVRHRQITGTVVRRLAERVGDDRAVLGPMDVFLDDENVFQADALVTPEPLPRSATEVGIPSLVVEVFAAGNRWLNRRRKLPHYLEAGVAEVWFVDPEAETVEIVTIRGDERFRGNDRAASEIVPEFRLTPADLFA